MGLMIVNYVKLLKIETKDRIEVDIPFDILRIGEHIISVISNGSTVAEFYGGKLCFLKRIYSPEKEMCLVFFDIMED